jgi:voltage-gated potassium channel
MAGKLKLGASAKTVRAVLEVLLTVSALLAVYYVMPLDRDPRTSFVVLGGILIVVAVAVLQVRSILRSSRPLARGVQALATCVPLYLLTFAVAYLLLELNAPNSFNQNLDKTAAIYFTMTVFSTVGFGDIIPLSETARVTVTVQMVGNLLVLGVLLRVLTRAVAVSRAREDTGGGGQLLAEDERT